MYLDCFEATPHIIYSIFIPHDLNRKILLGEDCLKVKNETSQEQRVVES